MNGRAQIHTLAYLTLDQVAKGALNLSAILPNITTASTTETPNKTMSQISPTCLPKALLLTTDPIFFIKPCF